MMYSSLLVRGLPGMNGSNLTLYHNRCVEAVCIRRKTHQRGPSNTTSLGFQAICIGHAGTKSLPLISHNSRYPSGHIIHHLRGLLGISRLSHPHTPGDRNLHRFQCFDQLHLGDLVVPSCCHLVAQTEPGSQMLLQRIEEDT